MEQRGTGSTAESPRLIDCHSADPVHWSVSGLGSQQGVHGVAVGVCIARGVPGALSGDWRLSVRRGTDPTNDFEEECMI